MRLLTWIAGLVGLASVARWLRRRHKRRAASPRVAVAPSPAAELRRKLDEARAAPGRPPEDRADRPQDEDEAAATSPAPVVSAPVDPPLSLEERRSRIHEKAREAIDLMHEEDR